MVSDPISDLLTRLRNASMVSQSNIEIPHSKFKFQLSTLLKDEGYVSNVKVEGDGTKKVINIEGYETFLKRLPRLWFEFLCVLIFVLFLIFKSFFDQPSTIVIFL